MSSKPSIMLEACELEACELSLPLQTVHLTSVRPEQGMHSTLILFCIEPITVVLDNAGNSWHLCIDYGEQVREAPFAASQLYGRHPSQLRT